MNELIKILKRLRKECPWDKEQTKESLRPLTIEETYELSEAILSGNFNAIKEELGDVLLHILFYAEIAEEENKFTLEDVCHALSQKLIYRHPHIFGNVEVKNSSEVVDNWEFLKLKEKERLKKETGALSGVPQGLPSIIKADRIQHKAAAVGFDWENREQVWEKVKEEIEEFEEECKIGNTDTMEEEFGDVLFSLINAARLYKINPDSALEKTNRKFIRRFKRLEEAAKEQNKTLKSMTLEEMEGIWQAAKEN